MSGGVDSSVAAALMVDEGYDVTGIMLKLWRGETANSGSGCCNVGAAEDARRVANTLDIPFYVFNFAERFEDTVVRDFRRSYASGRTPNPCVRCNQWIKFGTLLERAAGLGADVLATGHYARVRNERGNYRLLRGRDERKDQSYVLWMLNQPELARTRFPVGEMKKSETRRIANELGLRTADKPDSQEICFVRGGDLGAYVAESITEASRPGPIVDGSGGVVGEHRGIGRYTVGQRKGLGISLGEPVYVTSIDASSNTLTIGGGNDMFVDGFTTEETSFVSRPPRGATRALVQHRAHGDAVPAILSAAGDGRAEVTFDRPIAAVAPGQSAAFYSEAQPDELIGGGVIDASIQARAAV
jgi:tRNA-specific 2-thiouridylase